MKYLWIGLSVLPVNQLEAHSGRVDLANERRPAGRGDQVPSLLHMFRWEAASGHGSAKFQTCR